MDAVLRRQQRRLGAEHGVEGAAFEFALPRVRQMYRERVRAAPSLAPSQRCLRCATEDALGLSRSTGRRKKEPAAQACQECLKVAARERAEQLRLQREEARRQEERERDLARRRAKRQRQSYANMFKPKRLTPLNQRSSSMSDCPWEDSEPEEDLSENDSEEGEEAMLQPPPAQLESLLPIALQSKDEFIACVQSYRTTRRTLRRIKRKAMSDISAARERRQREREEQARQARHEDLVRRALGRLRNRRASSALLTWRDNVRMVRRLRTLAAFSSSHRLQLCWKAWGQYVKDWHIEKMCAAVVIQAHTRRWSARRRVSILRGRHVACLCLQRFARFVLAKNLTKIARRRRHAQEQRVLRSLLRLSNNQAARCFVAWRDRTKLMKHARKLGLRSATALTGTCMQVWKLFTSRARRERRAAAISTMQRIGRGFVARRRFVVLKRAHAAAISIQGMARARMARDTLRRKLRQRRVVRKKLQLRLGEEKQARFAAWKVHARQLRLLRLMMDGSRIRVLRAFFERWVLRRDSAIDVQRAFRGFVGRRRASARRQQVYKEMAATGAGTAAEREQLSELLDERYASPALTRLRRDLVKVKRLVLLQSRRAAAEKSRAKRAAQAQGSRKVPLWRMGRLGKNKPGTMEDQDEDAETEFFAGFSEAELGHPDEIELTIHGSSQQFLVSKHSDFLVDWLSKEILKEIQRLKGASTEERQAIRRENSEWRALLREFLGGSSRLDSLEDFRTYHRAGQSFQVRAGSLEEARETLATWKELYTLDYITRWTCISWIAEGFLCRQGIRATERLVVWQALQEAFERDFQEDCAAYVLSRLQTV